MIGLALSVALVLGATPTERHAAFLKLRLDGSASKVEMMRAELNALSEYWSRRAESGGRAQAMLSWRKREELLQHFSEELLRAPVPPEIRRLGPKAVASYKKALRSAR